MTILKTINDCKETIKNYDHVKYLPTCNEWNPKLGILLTVDTHLIQLQV